MKAGSAENQKDKKMMRRVGVGKSVEGSGTVRTVT
jgi:hypothetical protein